jgi:hypothetical protein
MPSIDVGIGVGCILTIYYVRLYRDVNDRTGTWPKWTSTSSYHFTPLCFDIEIEISGRLGGI